VSIGGHLLTSGGYLIDTTTDTVVQAKLSAKHGDLKCRFFNAITKGCFERATFLGLLNVLGHCEFERRDAQTAVRGGKVLTSVDADWLGISNVIPLIRED